MMWGNGWGMGWGGWLVMGFGTVAFWVVVVLLIRALLPSSGGDRLRRSADPLDILNERLDRGEVTPEEYEQRRRLIVEHR